MSGEPPQAEKDRAVQAGATHYFTNGKGHTYYGRIVGHGYANLVHFQCLCSDFKTWMQEPVSVGSPAILIPPTDTEE